eukprot:COSAG04_NODE_582_length_12404_cov_81.591792_6_plen_71_part_00
MGAREISLSGPFFDTSFVSSLYSFHTRFAAIGAPHPSCWYLPWGCGLLGEGRAQPQGSARRPAIRGARAG